MIVYNIHLPRQKYLYNKKCFPNRFKDSSFEGDLYCFSITGLAEVKIALDFQLRFILFI